MAILTGINTRMRGSVGDYTFSQLNGQTVVKQKVAPKAAPRRTLPIMAHRMKWPNLVNLYKAFQGNLHPSFEGKAKTKSDFNEFMAANLAVDGVFLPQDIAIVGSAVVAPYQVTRGSLPSVSVTLGDDNVTTGISVGAYTIDEHSMLGEFSQAITSNNPDFQDGDQITVFNAVQSVDPVTGIPVLQIIAAEVTLDSHDEETTLYDLPGVDASTFATVNRYLGIARPVKGGIAYVHSRKGQSKTLVSTQRFVCNNDLLGQYQGNNALWKAIQSYGGLDSEEFLTPNIAE